MDSLARNHPLVDGNKRLAWAATRTFCLLNGRDLVFEVDEAEAFVQAVARGELEAGEIATCYARRTLMMSGIQALARSLIPQRHLDT